jgi:hypothetical protein
MRSRESAGASPADGPRIGKSNPRISKVAGTPPPSEEGAWLAPSSEESEESKNAMVDIFLSDLKPGSLRLTHDLAG